MRLPDIVLAENSKRRNSPCSYSDFSWNSAAATWNLRLFPSQNWTAGHLFSQQTLLGKRSLYRHFWKMEKATILNLSAAASECTNLKAWDIPANRRNTHSAVEPILSGSNTGKFWLHTGFWFAIVKTLKIFSHSQKTNAHFWILNKQHSQGISWNYSSEQKLFVF